MPATIQKTLQGVIRLDTSDIYEFVLPKKAGTALPNALDNQVLEEVYIIVENPDVGITPQIVLPSVSDFNGAWNVKIYVVNKKESPVVTTPKIPDDSPLEQDYINFVGNVSLPIKSICYFHIVDNNLWACWTAQ
jgi:hypothetical protein